MAKKAIAGYREKIDDRSYSKVIKMLKSSKTGAYVFKEEIVLTENIKDFFEKN